MKQLKIENCKIENCRSAHGFTLAELLVSIAVLVVIGVVVFSSLQGRSPVASIDTTTTKIATLLREAQSKAVAGDDYSAWGVHFDNNVTSPFFSLFRGSYQSTSTIGGVIPLSRNVRYASASIASGDSLDVTFLRGTGRLATSTSIILEAVTGTAVVKTVTISISANGSVSF